MATSLQSSYLFCRDDVTAVGGGWKRATANAPRSPPDSPSEPAPKVTHTPLPSPFALQQEIPQTSASSHTVAAGRREISDVVCGRDPLDRLLVVVGPCSIHDAEVALEYCDRLLEARERYKGELVIVMRCYLEKPRTTTGWKGLLMDPDLDDSANITKGLRLSRGLLAEVTARGMPVATEMLSLISTTYVDDLLSVGFIGARTTESQLHRELASACEFPVGFKNGTDGSLTVAVNAIKAAEKPHRYLSICHDGGAAMLHSQGNGDCFVVLRGSSRGTNYDAESTLAVESALAAAKTRPRIMVDCSHGNAKGDHENQVVVARELAEQIASGRSSIMGVMLESHINGGKVSFSFPSFSKTPLALCVSLLSITAK